MFNSYFPKIKHLSAGVLSIFLIAVFSTAVDAPDLFPGGTATEEDFWKELNECTTGVASGLATPDGRPLLWKNRDVGNQNQEFHYYDDGRIPFISITYRNDTDDYYGGINAAGFAVENSNSYNLQPGPGRNGWGYGDDDGKIHLEALATCRTLDDFARLLDSTNVEGRTLNCNYGAFDAFGNAAMFETGGYTYTRLDAADAPDGFLIRSNYSYSGHGLDNRPSYWGPNRHDRAYETWKWAKDNQQLTVKYIYQKTIRNLHAEGMTDYELPYRGYHQGYPYGVIPNGEVICRASSQGILIAQGVREGENPNDAILWAMVANPLGGIFAPLWVRAGSVPPEFDSPDGSRICNRGMDISDWIYESGNFGRGVNTWKLVHPQGTGYWDWAFRIEDYVVDKVDRFINSPNFSYDQLEQFQNLIARQIADSMYSWRPQRVTAEIADLVFNNRNFYLRWGEINQVNGFNQELQGYAVYRASHPFRENAEGELIETVNDQIFVDTQIQQRGAFYRVEGIFGMN